MRLFILFLFSASIFTATSQTKFKSERALVEHAFSKTDFNNLDIDYVLDFSLEVKKDMWSSFFERQKNGSYHGFEDLMFLFKVMEHSDVNHNDPFEKDSVLFPVMDSYWSSTEEKSIPLFIFNLKTHELKSQGENTLNTWASTAPFPKFIESDFEEKRLYSVSLFADTITEQNFNIYWNDETFISNDKFTVDKVHLLVGNQRINIPKNNKFNVNSFIQKGVFHGATFEVKFSNGVVKKFRNQAVLNTKSGSAKNAIYDNIFGGQPLHTYGTDPEVKFRIAYGCDNGQYPERMNKPYIIFAGWGPMTDKNIINNNREWPADLKDLFPRFNREGFIENLLDVGYDVVLCQFRPPNEDIRLNADRVKYVINFINDMKTDAGSYEENIIHGYSAGALSINLALLEMEKDHLENNGPHHHSKLMVSYEGEHQGANIPLGMQHAVEYLDDNQGAPHQLTEYALHYILNAIQSRQLLNYFHTETGDNTNPGQGSNYWRGEFQNDLAYANHNKNSHNIDYPAFARKISISNGMNESQYNGSDAQHYPFDEIQGLHFFKHFTFLKEVEALFLKEGSHNRVFRYSYLAWGPWEIESDKFTHHPKVFDNAPGGMFIIEENPMDAICDEMDEGIGVTQDSDIERDNALYCFTPTISTHDIKNFDPTPYNGRLDYDFKEEGLLFKSQADEQSNSPSNDFGYPHLSTSNPYEITPFDALFTWNENTVHISSGRKHQTDPIEIWSEARGKIKNFIFGQTDYYFGFVQNRKFGWNARSNYTYKADVFCPKLLFVGDHVTQRTDFKPVVVYDNADIRFLSEEGVSISQLEIKPGAEVYIGQEEYYCQFYSNMPDGGFNYDNAEVHNYMFQTSNHSQDNETNTSNDDIEQVKKDQNSFKIYPNPGKGQTTVELNNQTQSSYIIYNVSGKVVQQGMFTQSANNIHLDQGVYIIKIKINDLWQTKKFIIQ